MWNPFIYIRPRYKILSLNHSFTIPLLVWTGHKCSRRLRTQNSRQSSHEGAKVVSPTHRPLLSPGNIPGTYFGYSLSRPQGHSAAGRIMSKKNSDDTIGNRIRDLPACSAVPKPTALPRVTTTFIEMQIILLFPVTLEYIYGIK